MLWHDIDSPSSLSHQPSSVLSCVSCDDCRREVVAHIINQLAPYLKSLMYKMHVKQAMPNPAKSLWFRSYPYDNSSIRTIMSRSEIFMLIWSVPIYCSLTIINITTFTIISIITYTAHLSMITRQNLSVLYFFKRCHLIYDIYICI